MLQQIISKNFIASGKVAPLHGFLKRVITMRVVKTINELHEALQGALCNGLSSVGLVPTMGALHEGHASLVRRSIEENDVTVVSDFVNPTQFNDPKDLQHYPRDFEADEKLLAQVGADILFAPSVSEMYPERDTRVFSYPGIDDVMEGEYRQGHFNGVCQIVSKLFRAVSPTRAYFGEKDFQQIAVVRAMVSDLKLPVEVVACPVVRAADGLALSSRNQLLSEDERRVAADISRILFVSRDYALSHSVAQTFFFVVRSLNALRGLKVQYFDIVDARTLARVAKWDDAPAVQGCIAVFCGGRPVRLIDNVKYK